MGSTVSRTITQGEPPAEFTQSPIHLRDDFSEKPFLAPEFASFSARSLYKVECPMYVKSKSVSMTQSTKNPELYAISFSGRCSQPCNIEIYSFAKEIVGELELTKDIELMPVSTSDIRQKPVAVHFNACDSFTLNGWNSDTGIVSSKDINCQDINLKDRWSFIIRITVETPSPAIVNTLQIYCAAKYPKEIVACVILQIGVMKIKAITQKCLIRDRGFFISELYGLGDMSNEDAESRECVVCMTNERSTCVLPCRHVCCCAECANTLRLQTDKCPVCREPMRELVSLTINPENVIAKDGSKNIEMENM